MKGQINASRHRRHNQIFATQLKKQNRFCIFFLQNTIAKQYYFSQKYTSKYKLLRQLQCSAIKIKYFHIICPLYQIHVTAELAVEFEKKNFDPLGYFALAWVCEILQNFAIDTSRYILALLKSRLLMWKRLQLQGKGSTVNLKGWE